jgi:hypothetical protein
LPLLTNSLTEWASSEEEPWEGVLRASSIGRCARSISYRALGYQAAGVSGRSQMAMDDGRLHEDNLIARIMALGHPVRDRQREVRTEYPPIVGHVDGIVEIYSVEYLLEIKTANHFEFEKIRKEGVERSHPEYYAQVQFYINRLGLSRAIVLLKNRSNAALHEELIPGDSRYYQRILDRATRLWESIQRHELFEREYSRESRQCAWCRYNHYCWPEVDFEHAESGGRAARVLVEDGGMIEAAGIWRDGKELEARAKELIGIARGVFDVYMTERDVSGVIDVDGLEITRSRRTRESIDLNLAKRTLPEEVLDKLVKRTEYSELRIADRRTS